VLETDRLVLRPLHEGDLDELFAISNEATGMPRAWEETRGRLLRAVGHCEQYGFGLWALIDREDGGFIGWCGVAYLHGRGDPELSYALARRYWGQGLATEAVRRALQYAFDVAGLPRVVGVARAENLASQRVMLRAGLTFSMTARRPCSTPSRTSSSRAAGNSLTVNGRAVP
jgi:ribosomal-protein-alanine N-acetyltransferase